MLNNCVRCNKKLLAGYNKRFYTKNLSASDHISKNNTQGQIHFSATVRNILVHIGTPVFTITVL
jgi:hypothetical protein